MTTIIGMIEDGKVYIGADSQYTSGWAYVRGKTSKVIRRGELLIGIAGDPRMGQIIEYLCDIPKQNADDADERYLIANLVESWRKAFKEYGYATSDSGQDKHGCNALIAYHGCLYRLESNFQIVKSIQAFDAIGTGSDFALGAMAALSNCKVEERIQKSLEIAESMDIGTCSPFHIYEDNET